MIFQSNTNNFQTDLFNTQIEQIQPLQVRVDLGVMVIKGYSTQLRALKLEPHYQMEFSAIPRAPLIGVRAHTNEE